MEATVADRDQTIRILEKDKEKLNLLCADLEKSLDEQVAEKEKLWDEVTAFSS